MGAFTIENLEHGKLLCGKNFSGYVEAWNNVVARSANLKGDLDTSQADGYITVDNTDTQHPIIRFDANKLLDDIDKTESSASEGKSCWRIDGSVKDAITLVDCYYMLGGRMRLYEGKKSFKTVDVSNNILAFQIDFSNDGFEESIQVMSMSDIKAKQDIKDYYIFPLYKFDGEGSVETDFRNAIQIQVWENF